MCFFLFISELKEKMCYFAGASLPGKVTLARGVARVCRFFFFSAQLWGLCACNFFRLRYNNGGNFLLFFLKEKKENVSNFPRTFSAGRRCPHSFFLFKKKKKYFYSGRLYEFILSSCYLQRTCDLNSGTSPNCRLLIYFGFIFTAFPPRFFLVGCRSTLHGIVQFWSFDFGANFDFLKLTT